MINTTGIAPIIIGRAGLRPRLEGGTSSRKVPSGVAVGSIARGESVGSIVKGRPVGVTSKENSAGTVANGIMGNSGISKVLYEYQYLIHWMMGAKSKS